MTFMKFNLTIILLFFAFNYSVGQEYTFDKVAKIKTINKYSTVYEHTDLYNSKDYSYYMQIYNRNDSLIARIFDKKDTKRHVFYLDKKDSLRPVYISTDNLRRNSVKYTTEYSKSKKEKDSSKINFSLKGKGKTSNYILTIDKSEHNYFPIFANYGGLGIDEIVFTEINPPFNCTVLKAEGTNFSGNYYKYELISINDINLQVMIPPTKDKLN